MSIVKIKQLISQNRIFYLIGFLTVFGLKYCYSRAGCDELVWILTPTARWVRILSGIPFYYAPQIGYINDEYRFIIASSCSGIQFMLITIATLTYSFVHRMNTRKKGYLWLALSVACSYLLTIFVNGIRIILAIHLPVYIQKWGILSGVLSPGQLHTSIGVVVYFTALFIIYHIAGHASQLLADSTRLWFISAIQRRKGHPSQISTDPAANQESSCRQTLRKYLPPVFWYFFIALGIPFLNSAYRKNGEQFIEYAILITTICTAILILLCLVTFIHKHLAKLKMP